MLSPSVLVSWCIALVTLTLLISRLTGRRVRLERALNRYQCTQVQAPYLGMDCTVALSSRIWQVVLVARSAERARKRGLKAPPTERLTALELHGEIRSFLNRWTMTDPWEDELLDELARTLHRAYG